MGEILDLAEALWNGETDTVKQHPFGLPRGMEKIAERTWFYKGFSNVVVRETDDGLMMVDPAAAWDVQDKHGAVRGVTGERLHTAIFTHGHVDHVFGVDAYEKEAKDMGWPLPRVIAHQDMPARFRRYRATVGWNGFINLRQFLGGKGEPYFPDEFRYPDMTYTDRTTINVGGIRALLCHARGETDDATWIYFEDTGVLATGDLFIWALPNAGNPQKVQRYAADWAHALRDMAALDPEVLAPGHGVPIIGPDRVRRALEDTAAVLESLHDQTVDLMNKGLSLDEVLRAVEAPAALLERPYLRPIYDEPEFVVRNIWRYYGGWYDGMPSHLKPATEQAQAREIARLAGGAKKLAARAKELREEGDLRLACHLAEWAYLASPEDAKVREVTSEVFTSRARSESSTMAVGVYMSAAREMGGDLEDEMPGKTVVHAQDKRGEKE